MSGTNMCFVSSAKNVFNSTEEIKMKSIVGTWDWGTDIFLKPFTDAWDVIKFIFNTTIYR